LALNPPNAADKLCGFPQSLKKNPTMIHQMRHDRLFSYLLLFQ
jgi:hypothetical protein